MPTELIPFVNAQESGRKELGGASPSAMNVWADPRGTVRRRPGVATYSGSVSSVVDAAGIGGLYVDGAERLFAASLPNPAASVYYVTSASATHLGDVDGGNRPTFAETEILLVMAAGGAPRKVVLSGALTMTDLGGTPPECSHIIAQNLRLLANDVTVDRTKVRYSDQSIGTTDYTGHEDWVVVGGTGPGFFTAESRPDPVPALYENTNEVWAFGTQTLQIHAPDANLVYAPVATKTVGCGAPYSVIGLGDRFAWLDHARQFVLSDGRGFEVISGPVQQDLADMAVVSDCVGYHILLADLSAFAWRFPTDGRTFVYQEGVGWGQWQGWSGIEWTPWIVTAHHQKSGSAENLVGTSAGKVGMLSNSVSADFEEDIHAFVQTGFMDRGTTKQKHCREVRLTVRRGHATSGTPHGYLQWRDSLGEWESPVEVSLGGSGDYETTVRFHSLGTYRTRQWRFQFDGSEELVLAKVEEDFEVL
jgi:hypothetical protein